MVISTVLLVISYLSLAFAHNEKYERYGSAIILYSCNYETYSSASFCDKTAAYYECLCGNKNARATIVGCMMSQNKSTSQAIKLAEENCQEYGNVTLSEGWFDESYQYYLDNAMTTDEIPNFNITVPIDVPLKFNETQMLVYYNSYVQFLGNYDDSLYYGAGALGYWLLVMLIEGLVNWSMFMFPGFIKTLTGGPIGWWREYVSMPATFKKRKTQELPILKIFDCLIPSRYESLVILGFYAYTLIVNAVKIANTTGAPIFDSGYEFQLRLVADRTGIVATIMMPLVFLFAGRNNFLQWLTGINYATFMVYHRHIARVMFMLVVIHSVNYTIIEGEYYSEAVKEKYFWNGILATTAGGILWIQAMLFFRRRWYEIFLLIHIIMAAIFVGATWVHVDDLGYVWFVYPSVAVWCFDRAVRIGRLIVFGFPKAEVTLLANDTLKVVVPKPSYWKSIPGGHAFIHFVKPTYFWQSHPFTFVDTPDDKNIVLYCKVKGGVTHSLYKLLAKQPDQTTRMTVAVEGPYGEPTPARYADTAVFIAGGNGIPGIYSEVMDMARRLPAETNRVMKLIWVIRDYSSLEWFQEELEYLKNTSIRTTIYVTRPSLSLSTDEDKKLEDKDSCEDDKSSIKSRLNHIEFKEGRPCIETIVADEIEECSRSVAFVTCGHPVMVDEIRYFAAHNIRNPDKKRVDFFEQLQVWA
ncbi:MAG: ferric reductase-like transmembrane domain-containing protein [Asgard group archaeon]|nr:ferric reductase-like transmembrane domain-containing protein [Asgard group archaeon]